MPAFIAALEQASPSPVPEGSLGQVETRAFFEGERRPIHMHLHRLGPGASLRVDGARNDVCVYVWEGSARAGETLLEPRSSLVVEFGATLDVAAGAEGAALLTFALKDRPEGA